MKFAAVKGQMGIWKYYITTLSFQDVAEVVSPITEEISNSDSYSNLLQRTITSNVSNIKEYLLEQKERFFNALVLAVYDGNPEWYELDVEVEEYNTYSVGVLELTGKEIIFPVDGQHRVAGIKEAIMENEELKNEKVPVILIGHENSKIGKMRTRRLFSTLNRRAKRVSDNEIVALDEDDVVAIATREMAETHRLFMGNRLIDSRNKSVPSSNKVAFTSILTLYEINKIIYLDYAEKKGWKKAEREKYLLYRPKESEVEEFISFVRNFWDLFSGNIPVVTEYLAQEERTIIESDYRGSNGGNLLFRPIALSQFVNAILIYKKRKSVTYIDAIKKLSKIPLEIQKKPWKNVLWSDSRKTINGRVKKTELANLMLFLADGTVLKDSEVRKLIEYILDSRDLDELSYEDVLDELQSYRKR